jgi:hypothetical protein
MLLVAALVLAPRSASASTIQLACVHRDYRMKLDFTVDPVRNTIFHDGVFAREVHIDKSTISFFVDHSSGEYFHFITRSTGRMSMRAPDGTVIHGFECREITGQSEAVETHLRSRTQPGTSPRPAAP